MIFIAFPVDDDRRIFCQLLKYSNLGGIEGFHVFQRVEMELGSLDVSVLGDVVERFDEYIFFSVIKKMIRIFDSSSISGCEIVSH